MAPLTRLLALLSLLSLTITNTLLTLPHLHVAAYPAPPFATLAVVLPLTGPSARGGQRAKAALDIVLSDINNGILVGSLLPNALNTTLKLSYYDSQGSIINSLSHIHTIAEKEQNLFGIIGCLYDNVTIPMSLLTSQLGIPTISPGAATPSLADPVTHPYFMRTVVNDELLATVFLSSLSVISWYRIAMITTDDDNGKGYADTFLRSTIQPFIDPVTNVTHPYEIASYVIPNREDPSTSTAIEQLLDELYLKRTRIFLLHANEMNERVLRIAHARGMVGIGPDGVIRQWTGEFPTEEIADRFQDAPEALFGSIGTTGPRPRIKPEEAPVRIGAVNLENSLRKAHPDRYDANKRMSSVEISSANALIAFATIWAKIFNDPTRTNNLYEFLQAKASYTSFLQIDGEPFTFLPTGDALINPDFAGWSVEKKGWVLGGQYDLRQGSFETFVVPTFAGGDATYPKDRDRIYVTGDELPMHYADGKMNVLAYVVTVLGAWTSLILLEQSLSFWSRGLWRQACGWIILAGIAFGACGIFPTYIMNYTAIELDSDATLWLDKQRIFATCLHPCLGAIVTFLVAILSVPGGRKPAPNSSNTDVSELSVSDTNGTGVSTTGKTRSGGDGHEHSAASHAAASHTVSSSSRTSRHFRSLKHRFLKRVHKLFDFTIDTAKQSTWRLPLSAFVLSMVYYTTHLVIQDGFRIKATFALSTNSIIAGFILSFFLNLISLTMYFHVTRSASRYFAPFLLSGSVVAEYFILTGDGKWKYDNDVNLSLIGSIVRADSSLSVIVSLFAGTTCVLLMLFNVNRLRLSRNTLDRMLALVEGQVRALESEILGEKEATHALQEQQSYFRRSLEVMNLCRPIFRTYAVAMALADTDEAAMEMQREKEIARKALKQAGKDIKQMELKKKLKEAAAQRKSSLPLPGGAPESSLSSAGGSGTQGASGTGATGKENNSGTGEEEKQVHNPQSTESNLNVVSATARREKGTGSQRGSTIVNNSSTDSTTTDTSATTTITDWSLIHAPKTIKSLTALLRDLAELGNLEGPLPSKTLQDIRLPQILSSPVSLEFMKDILAKNLSPENIALWLDIQRYRSLDNIQVRKAVADEIYQTFIHPGAKYEVNLSSFMRDSIQSQIYKGSSRAELFDEVEHEIYRLMMTNNLDSLQQSQMFKLAVLLMSHPLYKLKNMTQVNNSTGEVGGNVNPSNLFALAQNLASWLPANNTTNNNNNLAPVSNGVNGNTKPISNGMLVTPQPSAGVQRILNGGSGAPGSARGSIIQVGGGGVGLLPPSQRGSMINIRTPLLSTTVASAQPPPTSAPSIQPQWPISLPPQSVTPQNLSGPSTPKSNNFMAGGTGGTNSTHLTPRDRIAGKKQLHQSDSGENSPRE